MRRGVRNLRRGVQPGVTAEEGSELQPRGAAQRASGRELPLLRPRVAPVTGAAANFVDVVVASAFRITLDGDASIAVAVVTQWSDPLRNTLSRGKVDCHGTSDRDESSAPLRQRRRRRALLRNRAFTKQRGGSLRSRHDDPCLLRARALEVLSSTRLPAGIFCAVRL
ncbi:hypothetical protein MRX96_027029 [Rhipicephalus microplus]